MEPGECEQIFFQAPLVVALDDRHSTVEPRWYALGQTEEEEQDFWARADSTAYVDWSKARVVRTPTPARLQAVKRWQSTLRGAGE